MGKRSRGDGNPLTPDELKKLREKVGVPKQGPTAEQKRRWKEEENKEEE